jgi:hypothetical protein
MAIVAEAKTSPAENVITGERSQVNLVSILAGAFLLAYIFLGYYLIFIRGGYTTDSLARLTSAWLVFHGVEMKLTTIGFVWPPIPTLVLLPLAAFPSLVYSFMAPVIVSALCMVLSMILIGHLVSACGLNRNWQVLAVLLFAINPLTIIFAVNGMSEALLVVCTLAALFWLVRFHQTNHNTHMMFSGLFFGLLPLIRYESIILSFAGCALVLAVSWENGADMPLNKFRQYVEGRLLAFTSLVIYPIFLWMLANSLIMGNPIYFLTDVESASSVLHIELGAAGVQTDPLSLFRLLFGTWTLMFPLGVLATLLVVVIGIRKRSWFLAGFGLLPLIIPVTQFLLVMRESSVPRFRYLMLTVPLGLAVMLVAVHYLQPLARRIRWGQTGLLGFTAILFLFSNLLTYQQLVTYPLQDQEQKTWYGLAGGGEYKVRSVLEAFQMGRQLKTIIPPGKRVLVGLEDGFAIVLGARDPTLFMDHTDPDFQAAVRNPPEYVDYLLIPKNDFKQALNILNRVHPYLHARGAPWVELVDALPETENQWKLYKVIRSTSPSLSAQ